MQDKTSSKGPEDFREKIENWLKFNCRSTIKKMRTLTVVLMKDLVFQQLVDLSSLRLQTWTKLLLLLNSSLAVYTTLKE